MIEMFAIFVAGIVGSATHCIAMCGPFTVAIGASVPASRNPWIIQFLYSVGRLFTYTFLGMVAGFGGQRLVESSSSIINIPAALALLAGGLLIYQGLKSVGFDAVRWLKQKFRIGAAGQINGGTANASLCLGGSFFGPLLRSQHWGGIFLAGVFTGLLPCGLVYGFLARAVSATNLFEGGLVMFLFGLGTFPVMIATGVGVSRIGSKNRALLFRVAAWSLVLTGLISIARGVWFLNFGSGEDVANCPFCL